MDTRKLQFDEYIDLLEQMPNAEKTAIGHNMDIYHGEHPEHGEIILVCSGGENAAIIH